MTDKLFIKRIPAASGGDIGLLTLNKPQALNALDLDMAKALFEQLSDWQHDDSIALVVLTSEGDKAFCAGGDIVSMYQAMQAQQHQVPDFLADFFAREYQLDYLIHRYGKPVVVWGAGIVMGGGIGLLAGASHRILTPSSRLAMPEITIGLYPDVGASYFLPRAPGKTGLFLGLTGASVNATDGIYVGLGDYVLADDGFERFCDALESQHWVAGEVHDQLTALCTTFELAKADWPQGKLSVWQHEIDKVLGDCSSAPEAVKAILSCESNGDSWFDRAKQGLTAGSPITMHLVWEQCKRGAELSLEACFQMELIMSCRCGESGEFAEGVRALLIDKDKQPRWLFNSVDDVPADVVATHFTSPWTVNPLAGIGE